MIFAMFLLFSHKVVSYSATPWTAAHQASCPSLSPRVCSNSCPLSQWCHPTITSSVPPFFSCHQSFSASVLPMNIQAWFSLGLTGLISRVFSCITIQKHQFFHAQPSLWSNSHIVHDYWKYHTLTIWTFIGNMMSLLFNTLSSFVIAFLPRSKHLLISWLHSPSAVILEPRK